MLKAFRKHLKSKKSTNFMQYMKISRKEELDNNWINYRNYDNLTNDLVDNSLYNKDCFDLINRNSNNINNYNNCNKNYYYNYNNGREDKKRIELQLREEVKIRDFEAIQLNHQHLHALHRFRRHKKRGLSSSRDVVISFSPQSRTSIVNRRDFYYRFGKEEEEAMACFDFLNDICCDTDANDSNDSDSMEDLEQHFRSPSSVSSSCRSEDLLGSSLGRNSQLSLSDSCVEYYDSSD